MNQDLKQKIVEIVAELEGGEGSKFEELTGVRKAYVEQETEELLSLFESYQTEQVEAIKELRAVKVEGKDDTINDVAFNTWNGAIDKILSILNQKRQ